MSYTLAVITLGPMTACTDPATAVSAHRQSIRPMGMVNDPCDDGLYLDDPEPPDCTTDPGSTGTGGGAWGDYGGDSGVYNLGDLYWDAYEVSGIELYIDPESGSAYSDGWAADATCYDVGPSCTPRQATSAEAAALDNEIARLKGLTYSGDSDSACVHLGLQLESLRARGNLYFYDDTVAGTTPDGKNGQLMGIAHPPNDGTQLAGKIGVFGGGRSAGALADTFRHEAAHFYFGAQDTPTVADPTNVWEMSAQQIANYCGEI